jgi:hypothetical protein
MKITSYDWKLILLLSLPGPAIGILTLFGIIPFGTDRWFWLAVSIVAAVVIAWRVERGAFGHGAVVGFLLGATSKLIQGIWSGTYVANNPDLVVKFAGEGERSEFQYFVLMLVPFVGIANALIVGLMSHLAHRAVGRNRPR